jgi:hypothetical protein
MKEPCMMYLAIYQYTPSVLTCVREISVVNLADAGKVSNEHAH